MTTTTPPLFGDLATLAVERARAELKSGRAVRVLAQDGARLIAAVETLGPGLLASFVRIADSDLRVTTTAERAAALGWPAAGGGASRRVTAPTLAALRELAGARPLVPADASATTPGTAIAPTVAASSSLASTAASEPASGAERAALALAKHARLLPTVLSACDVDQPQLLSVTSEAIAEYSDAGAIDVERVGDASVPLTDAADSRMLAYRDRRDGAEHVAVLVGRVDPASVVDVRVHSACLTGDLFGSLRCDCGDQLRGAVKRFATLGGGVLLYVSQEGRGIGLVNKLRAYRLQDEGLDTIDADRHLGFLGDERRYEIAAALLRELGITRVRLHTNNTRKVGALAATGIDVVEFLTLAAGAVNPHNERYIRVRRERAGHVVPDPE